MKKSICSHFFIQKNQFSEKEGGGEKQRKDAGEGGIREWRTAASNLRLVTATNPQ